MLIFFSHNMCRVETAESVVAVKPLVNILFFANSERVTLAVARGSGCLCFQAVV